MNLEKYKTKRKGQPKRNSAVNRANRRKLAKAKEPNTSPKLREIYSTKTEWATKILPKPKEQKRPKKSKDCFSKLFLKNMFLENTTVIFVLVLVKKLLIQKLAAPFFSEGLYGYDFFKARIKKATHHSLWATRSQFCL